MDKKCCRCFISPATLHPVFSRSETPAALRELVVLVAVVVGVNCILLSKGLHENLG